MLVYTVEVLVKQGFEEAFVEATGENHEATRKEPGNIRFDLSQHQDEAGRFFLYEVYRDKKAVEAHKKTAHYLKWRETVAPWMAQPRKGCCFILRFPQGEGGW